jgi:hypothetical protein
MLRHFTRIEFVATAAIVLTWMAGCDKPASSDQSAKPNAGLTGPTAGASTAGAPTASAATVSAKPDVTQTDLDLAKAMIDDRDGMMSKLSGKTIQVTGVVKHFDLKGKFGPVFEMNGTGLATIDCFPEEIRQWTKVGPDQKITVRGLIDPSYTLGIGLSHCFLADAGGDTVVKISAKDLATEFSKGAFGMDDKYGKKWLLIDGTVKGKQTGKYDERLLVLEGIDKLPVSCAVESDSTVPDPRDGTEPGQHVTIFGVWGFPDPKHPDQGKWLGPAAIVPSVKAASS